MDPLVTITPLHILYLIGILVILFVMIKRKDTLFYCIGFIFLIGLLATSNFMGGFQTIYNSFLYASKEFMEVILTIALVMALSKCLSDLGSDRLIMAPGARIMKTPSRAFWVVGITMMVCSYFLWPSPCVALVGVVLLPVALETSLSPLGVAIAMNIFGHGIALSSDFFIQGAPAITAGSAGITASSIMKEGFPLFLTMSVVTALASYFLNKKHMMIPATLHKKDMNPSVLPTDTPAKLMAILTPVSFLIIIILLFIFRISGGAASSLVGGTAVVLMIIGSFLKHKKDGFDKLSDYLKDGFLFGIKIFVPVIVIGAFFFLGGDGFSSITGSSVTKNGILNDWAIWISGYVSLNKYAVLIMEFFIGITSGLDGSGFSGLPLLGSLAATFGKATQINVPVLAALGQITTIWVGGGVLIPWALIPVAAICNVEPMEVARRNFKPVMIGFAATLIVTAILL